MKALVLFDSVFGNTEKIARAIGEALADGAQVVKIAEATPGMVQQADLVIMGSPTRGFKPTEAVVKFLQSLPADALKGKETAAFDTRIPLESIDSKIFRKIVSMGGYADKTIIKLMVKKGAGEVPSAGFFVDASEGPLSAGELERCTEWAKELVKTIQIR